MLKKAQDSVKEFNQASRFPISDKPVKLTKNRVALRVRWMLEEIQEFLLARDISEQADAIADLIYQAMGVFVEMGVDGSKVFEIVHQSNMSKVRNDREIQYREDGKVEKPDGWTSPEAQIRHLLGETIKAND